MELRNNPSQETLNHWHNDPDHWRLGIFYYNKNDKRLFPPKRIKQLGLTVNFANPMSIFVIIVLVAAMWVLVRYFKSM